MLPAWALLEAAAAAGALTRSDAAAGAVALTAASLGRALPLAPAEGSPECAGGATLRVGVRTGAVSAWPAGSPNGALLAATLATAHARPAERGSAGPAGGRAAPRAPLGALAAAPAAAAAARAARAPRRAACLASMQPRAGAAGGPASRPAPAAAEAALALQTVAERLPGRAGALGPALTLAACAACVFGPSAEPGPAVAARHAAVCGEPAARWAHAPRACVAVQDADRGLGTLPYPNPILAPPRATAVWRRRRHWYAGAAHALLVSAAADARGRAVALHASLGAPGLGCLLDHRVAGRALLPEAAMFEAAAAAARALQAGQPAPCHWQPALCLLTWRRLVCLVLTGLFHIPACIPRWHACAAAAGACAHPCEQCSSGCTVCSSRARGTTAAPERLKARPAQADICSHSERWVKVLNCGERCARPMGRCLQLRLTHCAALPQAPGAAAAAPLLDAALTAPLPLRDQPGSGSITLVCTLAPVSGRLEVRSLARLHGQAPASSRQHLAGRTGQLAAVAAGPDSEQRLRDAAGHEELARLLVKGARARGIGLSAADAGGRALACVLLAPAASGSQPGGFAVHPAALDAATHTAAALNGSGGAHGCVPAARALAACMPTLCK